MKNVVTDRNGAALHTPSFIKQLFNHPMAGLLWLVLRVWVGWQWLNAGLEKFKSPAWMQTGVALKGFWMGAIVVPAKGMAPIHYAWYRSFLQMLLNANAYTWFAKFITIGEILVGIAMILGVFTWFSALMGGLMNFNYMLAGSASVNPMFFFISILLVLAWKVAGYFGADYFLVPWFASLFGQKKEQRETIPAGLPRGAQAR
ncbi:MAG TPA: DoxX family membrane protein [Anaerolineales bacterium]|nr:DoxX family membrane protein [Anaerolineales bacterium]